VPALASAADAGRSAAFRDVGQDDDLGVAGHAPALAEDIELDVAEAARERHLLGGRDRLPAEEDHTVFVVGALDRRERRVVEGAGKIHPGDLRSEHGGGRNDFHRHRQLPPLIERHRFDGDGSASRAIAPELAAERDREHRRGSPSDRVDMERGV
jgi:hypothetical protein